MEGERKSTLRDEKRDVACSTGKKWGEEGIFLFFGALHTCTLVGAPTHMGAWEKSCEEWPGGVMVKRRVGGNYGTLGKPSHWNGMPLGSGRLFRGRRRRGKGGISGLGLRTKGEERRRLFSGPNCAPPFSF